LQPYLETLFRHKAVFLVPLIIIPFIIVLVTFYAERQYVVRASIWVEGTRILPTDESTGRLTLNEFGARMINDRLRTRAFLEQVRDRSGMTDAVLAGEWPQLTDLQRWLDSNPLLRRVGTIFRVAPPRTVEGAMAKALITVGRSLRASPVGNNLIVIRYGGSSPALGQRLIEETLSIHQEERLATRLREAEAGVEYLTRQLRAQEERLTVSREELTRFEEEFPPPPLGMQRPSEEFKELQRLQQGQALDEARYLAALDRLEDLRLRSDASLSTTDLRFRVVDPPVAGSGGSRVPPRKLGVMGMTGLTLGIILGTVAIVLITWRDGTVRTRADVESAFGTLAIIDVPLLPSQGKDRLRLLKDSLGVGPRDSQDSRGAVDR